MPGPILHVGDTMICPHGGQVTTVPGSPRVMVSGMPVAHHGGHVPRRRLRLHRGTEGRSLASRCCGWSRPRASHVMGQPVIIQTSVGLCQSAEQIPQGPPQRDRRANAGDRHMTDVAYPVRDPARRWRNRTIISAR